ncbi:MAG: hypothetical protein CME40_05230 [Haliea sp.]|nr:hypothetical protein [Haliea sp.]MAL94463.1 hypothetical protein [Haliea sp.]|tara:strand:+ start:20219 stop:21019 length:801 start_codon:yes stop_codon:yes gene_type:complete
MFNRLSGTTIAAALRDKPMVAVGGVVVLFLFGWWFFAADSRPLPDFSRYDQVPELKQAFYDYLTPIVREQNDRLREERRSLLALADKQQLGEQLNLLDRWRVRRLAETYAVPEELTVAEQLEILLQRVDVVPLELALVQAAKESAWGRSRFAVKANNLFGHWCFEPGCGLVPLARGTGKRHELRVYASVSDAIASYMHNLNTHPRYRAFRELRARQRDRDVALSARFLADGLLYYSERREDYVQEVKAMIGQYREFTTRQLEDTQA